MTDHTSITNPLTAIRKARDVLATAYNDAQQTDRFARASVRFRLREASSLLDRALELLASEGSDEGTEQ